MPRPKSGESEKDYIARFMASPEAREDYPDEKQRAAVAYSLYEHRNVLENADSWPTLYAARHIEPGLVHYADLGPVDQTTGKARGMTLLVRKPAIDSMRNSFIGKPIVNEVHKSVGPDDFRKGRADGVVTAAFANGDDGWDHVNYLVWDEATKRNCENGKYSVSCAYVPDKIDEHPGVYHNLPYDGEVLSGHYTHLAIVANPRYEGARIYTPAQIIANSGGSMFKLLLSTFGKKTDVDVDKATPIEVDGKQVTLEQLVNSMKAEEAAIAHVKAAPLENVTDSTEIEVDGKKTTIGDLKNAHRKQVALKNAEDDEKKKKDKEDEEKRNADEKAKKDKEDEEEKERKNALEAKKAKDAEEAKRKDAPGSPSHQALKNAAETRGGVQAPAKILNASEKEALGSKLYGSKK